jgi:hypothetical protein
MKTILSFALLPPTLLLAACSFMLRSPDEYRDATKAVLDKRTGSITGCYDKVLANTTDPAAQQALQGTVAVHFSVEHDTGKVLGPAVIPARTTAPQPLQQCVLDAMVAADALAPPDHEDGDATFAWAFTIGPAGASATNGAAAPTASVTSAPADGTSDSAMSFRPPAGCPGAGMTPHALPAGPFCSWTKACPNDDPMTEGDHAQCRKTMSEDKCAPLAKAAAVCLFAYAVCGPDGKVDEKATEVAVRGACGVCKPAFDAYSACSGKSI